MTQSASPRNALPFSRLSAPRQFLVRLCQAINFGEIHDLLIKDGEPVTDPEPILLRDVKLDADERVRGELGSADFLLCAELTRLMALLDEIENGRISTLEVRAGLPRRAIYEACISKFSADVGPINVGAPSLPAARQAGSKGPVRRLMADPERKTAAEEVAGHGRDAWGGRRSEGRAGRREYPETTRVGDCFGS